MVQAMLRFGGGFQRWIDEAALVLGPIETPLNNERRLSVGGRQMEQFRNFEVFPKALEGEGRLCGNTRPAAPLGGVTR